MRPEAPAGQSICAKQNHKSSGFISLVSNGLHGAGGGSRVDKTGAARLVLSGGKSWPWWEVRSQEPEVRPAPRAFSLLACDSFRCRQCSAAGDQVVTELFCFGFQGRYANLLVPFLYRGGAFVDVLLSPAEEAV